MSNPPAPLEHWNLMDPAVQQCPYDFYNAARAEAPVYRMPHTGFYLVTSFDLCREVMRQPDVYESGVSPMALKPDGVPQEIIDVYVQQGWLPLASCSTSDPPTHTRVRSFLETLFTTQRLREIKPLIDRTAVELLDALGRRTEIDFVREFGEYFYIMNRGAVVAEGATTDLREELVSRHLSV